MKNLTIILETTSVVPLYRQVQDQFTDLIVSGRLRPGEELPPVRELAPDLGVNIMTVSRAYGALAREGLVERRRGRRMRVRRPRTIDPRLGPKLLSSQARNLVRRAVQLGVPEDDLRAVFDSALRSLYVRPAPD